MESLLDDITKDHILPNRKYSYQDYICILEFLLNVTSEEKRVEHKNAARTSKEDLLFYYTKLLAFWKKGVEEGFINDPTFLSRSKVINHNFGS